MGLGKNYEIGHQNLSEELLNSEEWENKEAATRNIGIAAMYLANINILMQEAYEKGHIDEDLSRAANFAGRQYNDAIAWHLTATEQIREAGL
jgi:hypothetical protein